MFGVENVRIHCTVFELHMKEEKKERKKEGKKERKREERIRKKKRRKKENFFDCGKN